MELDFIILSESCKLINSYNKLCVHQCKLTLRDVWYFSCFFSTEGREVNGKSCKSWMHLVNFRSLHFSGSADIPPIPEEDANELVEDEVDNSPVTGKGRLLIQSNFKRRRLILRSLPFCICVKHLRLSVGNRL